MGHVVGTFRGRVRLNQAGVDGHALAGDKTFRDTTRDGSLEQVPPQFAVVEPAMAVLGEGRVIRHPVAQIEAAKPAIREVQMHFFAEPPLRTDPKAIAEQKRPDQQFGIDGGTAGVTVEICKIGADVAQINEPIDGSQQTILGDMILQRELLEECRLSFLPPSHHRQSSPRLNELNQQFTSQSRTSFSTEKVHFEDDLKILTGQV